MEHALFRMWRKYLQEEFLENKCHFLISVQNDFDEGKIVNCGIGFVLVLPLWSCFGELICLFVCVCVCVCTP